MQVVDSNNKKSSGKNHRLSFMLSYFVLICSFLEVTYASNVSVISSSEYVGELATYTYSISNHTSPTKIQFTFGTWSPQQSIPFQLDYSCFYESNNKLSCTLRLSQTVIQCSLPGSLGSSFTVSIQNINNPSSTKPYPLTVALVSSSGIETLSTSLTLSKVQNTAFTSISHNKIVGAVSTSVQWFFGIDYYFDSTTFLKITYDQSIFTIDFTGVNTCAVIKNVTNQVSFTNWSSVDLNYQLLKPIKITNPKAALSNHQLTASLYFKSGTTTYKIQDYFLTISLSPTSFTTLSGTTSLQLGKASQTLSITSMVCPYTYTDKSSTNKSYTTIQFNKNYLTSSSCPSGIFSDSGDLKSCKYDTVTATKSINTVTLLVTNQSTFSILVTSFTYFTQTNQFLALCQSTYSLQFATQILSAPIFSTSLCNSAKTTGALNSATNISITISSKAAGDNIRLYGLLGEPYSPWTKNSNGMFTYVLTASDSSIIQFPYYNPTYLISTNSITKIEIYRPSINKVYASYDSSISICQVDSYQTLTSLSLFLSSSLTYKTGVTYTFSFDTKFGDYVTNDFIQVQFQNFQSTLFLTLFQTNLTATLGGITQNLEIVSNNILKIKLVQNSLISSSSINKLVISGFINPPIDKSQYGILMSLYNGIYSSIKQQGSSGFPTLTVSSLSSISQSPSISILTEGNTVNFRLTNSIRYQYFPSITSLVTLNVPFTCTSSLIDLSWPQSTQFLDIELKGCSIPFLTSSNRTFKIFQNINSMNSTTTSQQLSLMCSDYCFTCSSTKYCSSCVAQSYSSFFLLSSGSCYEQCPDRTYQLNNTPKCQSCYETCQKCSGPEMTECSACIDFFTLSTVTSQQKSITVCISTCGQSKFYDQANQKCQDCQIDCKYCIDKNVCFLCKDGASMVSSGQCDFTVCEGLCETCQGTAANCTSCPFEIYLYENLCYEQCPENTYVDKDQGICLAFTGATLYFPATITSIVLIIIVCILNKMIEEDMTQLGRQHINVITYSSAIFVFMQLFALIVMLVLTPNQTTKIVSIIGIVIWILCNIGFCIYYNLKIKNDDAVKPILDKMGSRSKCIYYVVLCLSVIVNLRTYRILYCGIFKGVVPYVYTPVNKDRSDKYKTNEVVNQNNKSESESIDQSTKFELKRPVTLYLTILSLIGTCLFLVSAIIEINERYFINMLLWGLDLLFVVLASMIITIIDIWAGLRRSYMMAIEKNLASNETLENLNEDEATQKKILHKDKTKKKMTKYQQNKSQEKKKPQKKFSSLKRGNKSKSPKPKPAELSPEEKARREQSERMKKIKDQYSGLIKKKSHRYDKSSEEEDQIPDVKIFDSIDFKEDEVDRPERIRKIQTEHQKMRSTHHLGKEARNSDHQNKGRETNMSWKMSDIFLGFLEGTDQQPSYGSGRSNDDKKTVKLMDTINRERKKQNSRQQGQNEPSQIEKVEFKQNMSSDREQKKKINIKIEDDFESNQ